MQRLINLILMYIHYLNKLNEDGYCFLLLCKLKYFPLLHYLSPHPQIIDALLYWTNGINGYAHVKD